MEEPVTSVNSTSGPTEPLNTPESELEITPSDNTTISESSLSELRVHFIDVGQGDAILIDLDDTEILIDGGRGSYEVADYIGSYVSGTIEAIIITHPHVDHIGGIIEVLDEFDVKEIWLNGDIGNSDTYAQFKSSVSSEGAHVNEATRRGDRIEAGNLFLDVIHPVDLNASQNNNSIVMSLSYGDIDFLFMGDADQDAEISMLAAGIVSDIEIIKVGNHGSRTASSIQFLEVVNPEHAIYMAGESNSYGHPHQETVEALGSVTNATIYGTDESGTIIVTTDGNSYSVSPTRITQPELVSDIRISNFSVSPIDVLVGKMVIISADFTNMGDNIKAHTAVLRVNSDEVETKTFYIDTRASQIISFEFIPTSAGVYYIELSGLTNTLIVRNDINLEPEMEVFINVVSVTDPVSRGDVAIIRARTPPGANCNITVNYESGSGEASGLYSKIADNLGNVSWTWSVNKKITPGVSRINVTAYLNGKTASQTVYFTIH